jgi:hypothetical protein
VRRHRSLSLICLSGLALSGLAVGGPASATPAAQAGPGAAQAVPDELVVGYVAGATAEQRERARARAFAQRAERVVAAQADRTEVELVRLPQGKNRDQAVAELQSDPSVAYAEPNWVYTVQGKPTAQAKPGGGGTAPAPDYFSNGSLWGMYGDASADAQRVRLAGGRGLGGGSYRLEGRLCRGDRRGHPVHPPGPDRQRLDESRGRHLRRPRQRQRQQRLRR